MAVTSERKTYCIAISLQFLFNWPVYPEITLDEARSHAPCGLRGCKNWPAPFPGRMLYKATKPGLISVLYLSMRYNYGIVVYLSPFYVLLVFIAMCAVFWLFWLSYQYLPSDWLERPLWAVESSPLQFLALA